MIQIPYPNIPNGPAEVQVVYLKKALFGLVDQVNAALMDIEKNKADRQDKKA